MKEVEDIYRSLRPLLLFCRLFGVAPFPIEAQHGDKDNGLSLYYSVALYIVYILLCLSAIYHVFTGSLSPPEWNKLDISIQRYWLSSSHVIVMLNVVIYFRKRSDMQKLFQEFLLLDKYMKCFQRKKGFPRIRSTVYLDLVVEALWFIFYWPVFYPLHESTGKGGRLQFYATTYVSFTTSTQRFLLHNLIRYLTIKIFHLNSEIKLTLETLSVKDGEESSTAMLLSRFRNDSLLKRVQSWRYIQLAFFRTRCLLVSIFGVLILLTGISMMIDLTVNSYFHAAFFFIGTRFLNEEYWVIASILWNCFNLLVLVLIVCSCSRASKEADSTGALVSEVLLKVKDHKARRELRLFSHQLLHTKFHFSACGFFSLDFSLLTSMTAAVVTHLVILIQFQIAEQGSNTNCKCPATSNMTESLLLSTANRTEFGG